MITEVMRDELWVLDCDLCPDKPDYTHVTGAAWQSISWNRSCWHIEQYIIEMQDMGTIKSNAKYQFNLSPVGSFKCFDQWALWVTVSTGNVDPDRGYMIEVSMKYDSEFYTSQEGIVGKIMPDDGRESIRFMLWDYITNELLKRQPKADSGDFQCPLRSHGKDIARVEKFRDDLGIQESLNAQVACVVLEGCCTYCYREAMGQDVSAGNFGMSEVKAPVRMSRPGSSIPPPRIKTMSTLLPPAPFGAGASAVPPWEKK